MPACEKESLHGEIQNVSVVSELTGRLINHLAVTLNFIQLNTAF